jgi:hypothetical protein
MLLQPSIAFIFCWTSKAITPFKFHQIEINSCNLRHVHNLM